MTEPRTEPLWRRLKDFTKSVKAEIRLYQMVLRDPRTPRISKWLLAAAVGYVLLPFDIIPDFIPVLGQIDDLIIVPFLVLLALRYIPKVVIEECRVKMQESNRT